MSSNSPQSDIQDQQWPFADNTCAGNKMELIASIAVVLVFILISFHLYVRHRRRNHVVVTIHRARPTPPTAAVAGGLDAVDIASLPTFVNRVGSSTNDYKEECAVCLSLAEEGEMMRLLPECKHAFHIECIDMWLHSHPTCPICRTRAKPMTKSEFGELLAASPLPERFGHGGRVVQEGGSESESSQISRMANDSRRWLSTVGAVDLERQ